MTENPTAPRITPPKDLGPAGRRLYRDVLRAWSLRVDEEQILHEACKILDVIERLDAEMATAPLVVRGSMGQPIVNSLIAEARAQRQALANALGRLRLPDPDAEKDPGAMARTVRARRAALSRWDRPVASYWSNPA
jgi:uncharacterized protein YejL (UPF0352 family)